MPNKTGKRRNKQRNNNGVNRTNSGRGGGKASQALSQGFAGVSGSTRFITADLTTTPPPNNYRSRPPRSLNNQVHFVRSTQLVTLTTSTTAITEVNTAWTASASLINYTNYLAVFDQYFLHSVVCNVTNTQGPGGTATIPYVVTAIDYDNITNLGSAAALDGFVTANTTLLTSGGTVSRYIEPTVAPTIGSSQGVSRMWVDSVSTGCPFYGFRCIVSTTSAATVLDLFYEMIWAFRNPI